MMRTYHAENTSSYCDSYWLILLVMLIVLYMSSCYNVVVAFYCGLQQYSTLFISCVLCQLGFLYCLNFSEYFKENTLYFSGSVQSLSLFLYLCCTNCLRKLMYSGVFFYQAVLFHFVCIYSS